MGSAKYFSGDQLISHIGRSSGETVKADPTVEPVSTVEAFSGVKSFSVDTSLHLAALAAYRQLSPKWSKPAWADNSESKRACLLAETPGPLLFAAHWSKHGETSFGRASSGSFLP